MPGWRRASPAAAVFRVCQRLYVARGETDARGGVLAESARWRLDSRLAFGDLTLESFHMGQRNARRRHFHYAVKRQTSETRT